MSLIDPEGKFENIMKPVIEAEGYDLVRVGFVSNERQDLVLEVLIEPQTIDGTLNLDDCARVSREISAIMDVEDPISGKYRLEVGSAGIERPLTREKDFDRFKGFEAKIELKHPTEEGQKRFKGALNGVNDNGVITLETETGVLETQIDEIQKAKLVYSDDLMTALRDKTV